MAARVVGKNKSNVIQSYSIYLLHDVVKPLTSGVQAALEDAAYIFLPHF